MSSQDVADFIDRGFKVVPVHANDKRPLLSGWPGKASSDPEQIDHWRVQYPNCNWALVTGSPSGVVVLDVDNKNGVSGSDSITQLGLHFHTLTVKTPNEGLHYYFRTTKELTNKVNLLPGVDFRAEGGCAICPPSSIDGSSYQIIDDREIQDLPKELIALIDQKKKPTAAQGTRNTDAFNLAIRMRKEGKSREQVSIVLLDWASRCNPPLACEEVRGVIDSAFSYEVNEYESDIRNGRAFAEKYANVCKCIDGEKWILLDSGRWGFANVARMESLAKEVITDRTVHGEFRVKQREAASRVRETLKMARSEREIYLDSSKVDAEPYMLGVNNGVLDLEQGKLVSPTSDQIVTNYSTVRFEPGAECPRYLRLLHELFSDNQETISYIQRIFGYCLTGDVSEQVCFYFYGNGANGKSTLTNVLAGLLGEYAIGVSGSKFARFDKSMECEIARMAKKRVVLTQEMEEMSWNEGLLKQLTGESTVTGRRLYCESFELEMTAKLLFQSNYMPPISGTDDAIWRRLHVVPFCNQFLGEAVNTNLLEELSEELPGILNWSLTGFQNWRTRGLAYPGNLSEGLNKYRLERDYIGDWIESCCQRVAGHKEYLKDLHGSFKVYCEDFGRHVLSNSQLKTKLLERRMIEETTRGNSGIRVVGLKLL